MGEAVSTAALTVEHFIALAITIVICVVFSSISWLQVEDIGEKFPESRGELRFLVPLQVVISPTS